MSTSFTEAVERKLQAVTEPDDRFDLEVSRILAESAEHIALAGKAKRARPRLVHLFGRLAGISEDRLLNVAASAELFHTASLMHDDVIDDADTRRGQPSVQQKWRNKVAILGGDWLLCEALSLLERYPESLRSSAIDMISSLTRGIISEDELTGRIDIGLDTWRSVATQKTGALFGWACSAGYRIASETERAEITYRVGLHFGIAFQLLDDVKDLVAESEGKPKYQDLRNGIPSFVKVDAAERSDFIRANLAAIESDSDSVNIEQLADMIVEIGSLEAALNAINREVDEALTLLSDLEQADTTSIEKWLELFAQRAHKLCTK